MSNFIHEFWRTNASKWNHCLTVRFPPEPNGYLHIGHVKALLANSDLAEAFGGTLLLRMDDTNPSAEKDEYEKAIVEDIDWLEIGFDPVIRRASDHFPSLLELAWKMIDHGEAYIDTSSKDELSRMRGSFNSPGIASVDRGRSVAWHKDMFAKLVEGSLPEGRAVLRARMDLGSPNMVLRDPVLWRWMAHSHPRLPGWSSFPTYDFAHPFCDLRDGVSLSLCSLEFEEHKPLYNHVVERAMTHGYSIGKAPPVELEFSRLDPDVGITSKRVVKAAVESGAVTGWDDPRLLTLRGLRKKGYTPEMVKRFVRRLGVSRSSSKAPMEWLDEEVREVAGNTVLGMAIVDPVPLTLSGPLPETIKLADGREIVPESCCWVGLDDVRAGEDPGFRRLMPGSTVRLMGWGGFVSVDEVISDDHGLITAVNGRYRADGKSKATVHILPMGACERGELIHTSIWDGSSDPAICETHSSFMIERHARSIEGVFHAPRVGWLSKTDNGWRMLAGMLVRAVKPRNVIP